MVYGLGLGLGLGFEFGLGLGFGFGFGLGFGFGTSNTNPKYNPFLVFSHNWIFKIQILQDPSCSPSNPLAVQDPFCVLHLHCPCPLTPNIVCVVCVRFIFKYTPPA